MATSLRELVVSVTADTSRYQREMDRASRMGSQYFRTVREGGADASRAWGVQTAAARTHATAIEASAQAIHQYAAVAAGAFSVGALVGMADDWGQISARIKLATQDQGEFALAQTRLMEIANRTYRDYTEAADQFAGTAQSMREMGFAAADTLNAAEALGLALVAGGSNAQRGAAANDAWAKSMVQGKIATNQFQTLLLQTPRVVQALGEGLGKTTAELQQMAKDGQLTAQVVVPALTSQLGKLNAEVEAMPTTVADAGIRFRNELRAWVGGQNEAFGATQVLVGGIELVTENLEALITVGGAAAFGAMAGKLVQMGRGAYASAAGFIASRNAQAAMTAARIADAKEALVGSSLRMRELQERKALANAAVMAATTEAEMTRAMRAYTAATRQASIATANHNKNLLALDAANKAAAASKLTLAGAARTLLGLVGGPAGLAIMVGTAAAGWLLFRDNNDKATESLIDFGGAADQAIEKFRELNRAQQAGQILKLEEQISESADNIRNSLNKMFGTANQEIGSNFSMPYREAILGLQQQFDAGKISADEFSAKLSGLTADLLEGKPAGDRLRETYIRYGESVATSAREVERKRGVLQSFNAVNAEAGKQANVTAGAVDNQAKALQEAGKAAEQAGDKIRGALSSIPGQIARIGKNARQVAALDVTDWFKAEAAAGTNFANRDDPKVQEKMRQAAEYIRLQSQLAAAQDRNAASTRALSAARKEANSISESDKALEQLNQSYAEQVMNLEREIALYGEVGRSAALAYDLANGSLSLLTEAQQQSLINLTATLDAMDDYAAIYDDISGGLRGMASSAAKTADQMTAYADQAARNIQSYLGDSMYSILDGKFSDIGDSFSQMIKRMLSELAASQLLNMLGGAMSGYAGAGGFGDFVRGVGGSITKGAGKAGGGVAQPRTMMPVAEHGPELLQVGGQTMLMMGAQQGLVSPLMNKASGGSSMSGGAMQVIINNNGDSKVSARQERGTAPDGSSMRKLIIDIIADDIASGGATATAGKGRYGWQETL